MIKQPIVRSIVQAVARTVADQLRISGGVAPLPDPTTVNFTSAQFSPGFSGSISTTKNAARIYARGALTLWCGWITGTEAKLTAPSDFGDNAGSMEVAIDGGTFSAAPNAASVYTLFAGLSHAKRFVEVRWVVQMGDAPYIASSGNVLEVTGQPPALAPASDWVQAGADSATGLHSGAMIQNVATYTPALLAPAGTTYGSNVSSIKLKGAFSKLVVTVNGARKIGISKNGGAPAFYSIAEETDRPSRAIVVPCDGSTSTYVVWDSGNSRDSGGHFAVSGDSTLLDIGSRIRIHQPGDSITAGSGPGATAVNTEVMPVAATLGAIASTFGISGHTISGCKTMLSNVLPLLTVGSSDIGVLAIGGNSAAAGIDQTEQDDYGLCIDQMLAKPYAKVLCRGILPKADAQALIDAANITLKAVMDAKADPRLVWIDTSPWVTYRTQDGTHPTDSGYYPDLYDYELPAYTAILNP